MLSWGQAGSRFFHLFGRSWRGDKVTLNFSPLAGEPVQEFWLKMGPSLSTGLSPPPPPPIFQLSLGHLQ